MRPLGLALVLSALLAPSAQASRGDLFFETVHYTHNDLDGVHLLRIASATGAVSTVTSSSALPPLGEQLFARSDGTVLVSDGSGSAAVDSGSGQVRKLSFRVPGQRLGIGNVPIALGFRRSGGADYELPGYGIFASGPSLGGRLRLIPGSLRAGRPSGHVAGVIRQLAAGDGSIIGEVTTSSAGGTHVFTRFQRPRTRRTRTIVEAPPIRTLAVHEGWGTLPGGGIVVATGRPQRTVFYVAKPRRGRWALHRFAPPWRRPVDDGGIAVTGLPGGDIAIVRQTTADNGGVVLDEGIQVLRMAPGGKLTTLYERPPSADGDHALGVIAAQP